VVSIPGKTFLVGEYAVLIGGEALGLATRPQFYVESNLNQDVEYHPQSAVSLFCKKHNISFSKKIINPYGVGGFGQSTAEFIFAWVEKNKKISRRDLKSIFQEYLSLFSDVNNQNKRPSGADLVTQALGQVTHFKTPVEDSTSYTWPFSDLSFFVISTGLKIKTHEHLETLDRRKLVILKPLSQKVIQSFLNRNKNDDKYEFIENLRNWSHELEQMSLQHADVLKIKSKLLKNENILLVKPCGALGADVCLVFCDSTKKDLVGEFLKEHQYHIQASELDLSAGFIDEESKHLKDHV